MVLLRANKRKQKLVINKVQNVSEHIEMKLKQEETTEKEANSRLDQPLYAVIHEEMPPSVPSKSQDVKCLNPSSEYELVPADSEYAVPTTLPELVNLPDPMFEEMESNPMYFTFK